MAKSIDSSVGYGGRNVRPNVITVQYLLNCVPAGRGGPVPELAVDGIFGPKTLAAIRKFQNANLGFADGRVDPGGKTITALGTYDPYPNQPLGSGFAKSPTPSGSSTSFKDPFGKDPFAKDPFGKGPFGKDPFGKQPPPGKWGSGGKWGW